MYCFSQTRLFLDINYGIWIFSHDFEISPIDELQFKIYLNYFLAQSSFGRLEKFLVFFRVDQIIFASLSALLFNKMKF